MLHLPVMNDSYNVIKSLHIIFMVSWFAGLFYIVRLFIYHVEANKKESEEKWILQNQYKIMQKTTLVYYCLASHDSNRYFWGMDVDFKARIIRLWLYACKTVICFFAADLSSYLS